MAIHQKAFREELYLEHLEEAGFLYETRLNWLTDSEVGWQDIEELDARTEAHLDALIVGEMLAVRTLVDAIPEADFGMLHIIVRVFCRYQLIDRLNLVWKNIDYDDAEKVRAVADALVWESPKAWSDTLREILHSDKVEMFAVVAPCLVKEPLLGGKAILKGLTNATENQIPDLCGALAKCDKSLAPVALEILAPLLQSPNNKIVQSALLAVLSIGEARALNQAQVYVDKAPLCIALGGNGPMCKLLLEVGRSGKADANTLMAIGVAGQVEGITVLLAYLKHPDFSAQAALALQLITAANLFEFEHIDDKVESDELFEHEVESFEKGDLPKNINGDAFGHEVKKLSTEYNVWLDWVKQNKQNFDQGLRYRNGKPYSPAELLSNLLDNQSPYALREIAYHEMAIRYDMRLPFSSTDLIAQQKICLNEIHRWLGGMQGGVQVGKWYFSGREIT